MYKAAYQAMWRWIANNPAQVPRQWPEWKERGGTVDIANSVSIPCHVARITSPDVPYDVLKPYRLCTNCPVQWNEWGLSCNSLWEHYHRLQDELYNAEFAAWSTGDECLVEAIKMEIIQIAREFLSKPFKE